MPEFFIEHSHRHLTAFANATPHDVIVSILDDETGYTLNERTIENTFSDALTRIHGTTIGDQFQPFDEETTQDIAIDVWEQEMEEELKPFLKEEINRYLKEAK